MKNSLFTKLPNLFSHNKWILPEVLSIIFVVLVVFFGVFFPLYARAKKATKGTVYTLASGFTFDYYQYLSWIKRGGEGKIILNSYYTQKVQPGVFIHPFFPLLGMVSRPLKLPPYQALIYSQGLSLGIFLAVLYYLFRNLFPQRKFRILALFLLLSSTSFYRLTVGDGNPNLVEPLPWVQNFNVITKFSLPPHHLLALSIIIITLLFLCGQLPALPFSASKSYKLLRLLTPIILGITAGFLNPAILLLTWVNWLVCLIVVFLFFRKNHQEFILKGVLFLFFTAPVLLYHFYIFKFMEPWSIMYRLMGQFNPVSTFREYVLALGPLFPLSLISVPFVLKNPKPIFIFLIVWLFLPLLIYPLCGQYLPVNTSRLFQSNQYIPMVILAVMSLQRIYLLLRPRLFRLIFFPVIIIIFLAVAIPPFYFALKNNLATINPNAYNVFLPQRLINAFNFLEKYTKPESVVLSGEFVSSMIPAFSHNRTILGRDDSTDDYYAKQTQFFAFLGGKISREESYNFLYKYSISYLLLGIDTNTLAVLPLKDYPFLESVFEEDGVTVVKVNL